MFINKIINFLPINSHFIKLLIGSAVTALIVALGMVYVSELIRFQLNPALPAIFASISAALYASKYSSKI